MKKFFNALLLLLLGYQAICQNDDPTLRILANQIRNETIPGANTSVRIGNMFLQLINNKQSIVGIYTASGTNTYTVTIVNSAIISNNNLEVTIKFTNANTGVSTININNGTISLGAQPIVKQDGSALTSGTIPAGAILDLAFNGTSYQIKGGGGGGGWPLTGSATLTGTVNVNGSQTVNIGTGTALTGFNVTTTGGYLQLQPASAGLVAFGSSVTATTDLVNIIGANATGVNQFKLGLLSTGPTVYGTKFTVGGVDRLLITEAGVIKFLPTVAPVVGQVPTATNVDGTWTWQTPSGGSLFSTSVSGIVNSSGGANKVLKGDNTWIALPSVDGDVPISSGTSLVTYGLHVDPSFPTSGRITVGIWNASGITAPYGGTGFTSYSVGDILRATTTTALGKLPLGTALQVLQVNAGATDVEWASVALGPFSTTAPGYTNLSGNNLSILKGANTWLAPGTALQNLRINAGVTDLEWFTPTANPATTDGDLIQWSSGAFVRIPDVATGNTLLSGGAGAIWTTGKIGLTTHVSGTLPVGNGGTGLTVYAIGDIPYASGTTTLSSLADVAAGAYLRSGGVNVAPLWSTLILPNSATANRIAFASSTNTYGESANLTFVTNRLSGTTLYMTVSAGATGAGTAPIKFTAGSLMTTAEAFGVETNANSFYQTKNSTLRYGQGGVIFDNIADANNGTTVETDLYTYTTPANTLAEDADKIVCSYIGTFNDVTATGQLKVYFAGTAIGNTGALTISATGGWVAQVLIIRTSSTTARAAVNISTPGASTALYTAETDLTGLTLSGTNIIKITGQAGGASGGSNDITGKFSMGYFFPAAHN